MVADSSALIAILWRETEADAFLELIVDAEFCLVSAVSIQETSMVLAGRNGSEADWGKLTDLIAVTGISVVPHDAVLAHAARVAFLRYGKGRHPAGLNMGDCAAYALAKTRHLKLLFKGDDFSRTDLISAAA